MCVPAPAIPPIASMTKKHSRAGHRSRAVADPEVPQWADMQELDR